MEGGRIFEIVMEILFWFSIAVVAYMLILKITGHSPTDVQIMYGILGSMFVYIVAFSFKAGKFAGKVEEFIVHTKGSLKRIEDETKLSLRRIEDRIEKG